MEDPGDLERFVQAQDAGGTWERALGELRAGAKRSHWMWFAFPQLAGLGRSEMAQRYALAGVPEARAYLAHPVLGPRLLEACEALLGLGTDDPVAVLGSIDATKLRSSMTLFELAAPEEPAFADVLTTWFGGARDDATLERCG